MEEVTFPDRSRKASRRRLHQSRAMRISRGLLGIRERLGILGEGIGVEQCTKVEKD